MIPQRKPERTRLLSTSICDCALYPSSGSCGGLTGGEGHPFKKIFRISNMSRRYFEFTFNIQLLKRGRKRP